MTEDRVPTPDPTFAATFRDAMTPEAREVYDRMTEDRVPTLNVITAHIEREARRIGTYHGEPAATPGGTGYCIPAAVATQIVDKYLSEQPAPPLDVERLHRAVCEAGWLGDRTDEWHRRPEGEWPCHDIVARLGTPSRSEPPDEPR